ncbi:hypothetical protein XA68_15671 [Ophiocordyceps unilateralis]|uniref:Uncharacterized protein n=1 Tax=Ophiocordyceps unilateralis TaxID=268505 RepID=A0A2A9P7L1_OPHUN|nr:hypothetical protein XA68_15671 [Ophiocordyceps unilateralis]
MNSENQARIPGELEFPKVQCAFCGVILTEDGIEQRLMNPQEAGGFRNFFHGREEDTRWLNEVTLIGNNPKSNKPLNVEMATEASDFGNGNFMCNGTVMKAYHRREGEPFIVPFHDDCFVLLQHYLTETRDDDLEVDLEVLYDAVNSMSIDSDESRRWGALGVVYPGTERIALGFGNVFTFPPGTEHMAMSPLDIPELDDYLDVMPLLDDKAEVPEERNKGDVFFRLSTGTMNSICQYLDPFEIAQWRWASQAAASLDFDNDYWRVKSTQDLPWVFDYHLREWEEDDIDWEKVYRELTRASQATSETRMLGLVNRRRLWEKQGPVFGTAYKFALEAKNSSMRELARRLDNLDLQQSVFLRFPLPLKTATYMPTLIKEDLDDLEDANPIIVVHWTEKRNLAGIDVLKNGHMETMDHLYHEDLRGGEERINFFQQVPIPRDDWVTGLVIYCHTIKLDSPDAAADAEVYLDDDVDDNTRDEALAAKDDRPLAFYSYCRRVIGVEVQFAHRASILCGTRTKESRLVHAPTSRFVVGFRIERQTATSCVTRVGLVMAPKRVNMPGMQRVDPDNYWCDHEVRMNDRIWTPHLPPTPLRVRRGVGWVARAASTRPSEVLVLGRSTDELSRLISISVDDEFRGIRADYLGDYPRLIGRLGNARQVFDINGPGGEIIVSMFVTHDAAHGSWRLELVTNLQRHFAIDQGPQGEAIRMPEWSPTEGLHYVGGIYGCWLHGNSELAGIGMLTLDSRFL